MEISKITSSLKLKTLITNEELPPPNPLAQKTFKPIQGAFHIGAYPFLNLPFFKGKEKLYKKVFPKPKLPDPFVPGTKIFEIFAPDSLVFKRDPKLLSNSSSSFNFLDICSILSSDKSRQFWSIKKNCENDKTIKETQENLLDSLVFESRFESGNLSMVSKVAENEYNLLLQNDINTLGNNQWFFFKVKNKAQQKVKFNILNMNKPQSLFTQGMQVSIYSVSHYEKTGEGWFKGGSNIRYFCNNIERPNGKFYYTLTFTFDFLHETDSVYFAYSIPYTYSKLLRLLDSFEKDPRVSSFLLRVPLTKTIGSNCVYLLTITSPASREELKTRKVIFLSARVHPGETVSSFIMHGLLSFLTGPSKEAETLRDKFIFKIVPMLNPDGVVNGNSRCSLIGVDLNRRWINPFPRTHAEIYSYKKLIEKLAKKHQIAVVADFHGHSIKHNVFAYGCNHANSPHLCKAFPFLLSTQSEMFSFNDCNFSMHPSKSGTLRIVVFREMGINNTFTVESSFCGNDFGKYKNCQLTSCLLKRFGEDFCRSFLSLEDCLSIPADLETFKMEINKAGNEADTKSQNDLSKSFLKKFLQFKNDELLRIGENFTSGSDSDPSEDNFKEKQILKKAKKVKKIEVSQSSKVLPKNRCKNCGKIEYPGHMCIFTSKDRPRFLQHTFEEENEEQKTRKLTESPFRSKIYEPKQRLIESLSRPKFQESPIKANDPRLNFESSRRAKEEEKSEKSRNKKNGEEKLRFGQFFDLLVSLPPLEQKLSNKDLSSEIYRKNSVSPLRGRNLLGIVEGIQCKLQKFSKSKASMFRSNINKD